jgi:hypothetical protein
METQSRVVASFRLIAPKLCPITQTMTLLQKMAEQGNPSQVDWSGFDQDSPSRAEVEAAWEYYTRTVARPDHPDHRDYISIVQEETFVADRSSINWCHIRLRFRGRETEIRENGNTKRGAVLVAKTKVLRKCGVDVSKAPLPRNLDPLLLSMALERRRRREQRRTEQPDSSAPDSTSGNNLLQTSFLPWLPGPSTIRTPPVRRIPPSATISVPPPEPQPSVSVQSPQPQSIPSIPRIIRQLPIGPLHRIAPSTTSVSIQTPRTITTDSATQGISSLPTGTSVNSQGLEGNVARHYLNFLVHSCFRGGETVYAFNSNRTGIRVIVRLRDGRELGEDNEYVSIQGNEEMARELAARNALVRRFGICFAPEGILRILEEQRRRKNLIKRAKIASKRCGDEDKGGRPPKSRKQ